MDETEKSTNDMAGQIRGNQIHAMESNVPMSLIGYLLVAAIAGWVAYDDWSDLLIVWGPFVTVVCIVRIGLALKTSRRPVRPMTLAEQHFLMVATGVVSISMAIGPTWIALHSQGFTSAIMIMLLISAMWGGALVQATVFSSAVSYSAANVPVWLVYLAVSEVNQAQWSMALLFIATIVIAIDNVKRYARLFEEGLRQKLDLHQKTAHLEQQAEVIGLLLREHEAQSSDWLWQIDVEGRIVAPSARFAEAFGGQSRPLAGTRLPELFSDPSIAGNAGALARLIEQVGGGRSFRDLIIPGSLGGQARWWSLSGRPVRDAYGRRVGYRGVMSDVTVAKEAQAHVAYLAHHDPLTGLANRAHFSAGVQADLDYGGERKVSVLAIDLDGFKAVNDRFGHPVGDALLVALAKRLRVVTAADGVVARLGGDQFAVATCSLDSDALEALCRRLNEALARAVRIGAHDIAVGASIGVAVGPDDGRTVDELLRNADSALCRAKREGRGQFRFFEAGMDRQMQVRAALLQELREAIPAGQLSLFYQPYVDSRTGSVTGCEALLRWHHPTRGMVSPADFIPLAEESGLITVIGKWVIERACETAATWPDNVRISVNVSPRQFKDSTLPTHIEEVLLRTGLPASRLEVEVTEAVLIDDAAVALEILRRIRAIGVKLSLDDFGTGYSSLSYLRDFPFDKVKIDRSFVRDIEERHDSQVIVQGIRSIALGLGMTITAEGVETTGQAQRLRTSGCHELQGFLFSKAQPEGEVPDLLRQRHVLYGNDEAVPVAVEKQAPAPIAVAQAERSNPIQTA